jgi:3-oxoacyl-[acyl-carrier-protein] synthase II
MSVFIQGLGNISVQNTFGRNGIPEPAWYSEPYVRCIDPDFKQFLNPLDARRMSKLIKRAIITAKASINDSGIALPDAIISGTGLGSIDDTEKFLTSMIENDEKLLQPTFFIQSTHNTISSQIAINLKCFGHNNTFVQGGISFECALSEAMMLFSDNKINSALVGGYDEMTPAYFKLLNRIDFWKKEPFVSNRLIESNTSGSMAGEGSVSVVLSKSADRSYAEIRGMELLYCPEEIERSVSDFLKRHNMDSSDIDMVVTGINGDSEGDSVYFKISDKLFSSTAQGYFKHLSGEYFTSAGFGVWLIANILKESKVPEFVLHKGRAPEKLKNVLLINHYRKKNYSLILFSAC